MGLLKLFKKPERGLYLAFRCLNCDKTILLKVPTDTLRILKAGIREPDYCDACGNKTNFKFLGADILER